MLWRFGDCEFDDDRVELRRRGEVVAIEPRAVDILVSLLYNHERVVTKEELLDVVWGDRFVSESALTTQIKELRRAVGDSGREQRVVKTVHGRGYAMAAPVAHDVAPQTRTAPASSAAAGAATSAATSRGDPNAPGTGASGGRFNPIVAVLPFVDLSPGTDRQHIAAGLTHDLTAALSRHRWLRVLTRAATSAVAAQPDPVGRLRDEFDADYVVEGTVLFDLDRMRVAATLTDTATGACRWTERFDRQFEDVFAVLDEITEITAAIVEPQVGLAERERAAAAAPTDLATWDLFHLGLSKFYEFSAEGNLEAQRLLGECRERAPDFADAHAWWAYSVVLGMVYWSTDPDPQRLEEALDATGIALAFDNHNAVFHMLKGRVLLARREYQAALRSNQRAVQLNPTFAGAFCGLGDSLSYEGRYDEAIEYFSRSVELGSHDPQRWAFLSYGSQSLLFAGRFEEALEWARRASVIPNCQYWTEAHSAVALAHLDRLDEAGDAAARVSEMCPDFSVEYAQAKLFYLKRPEQLEIYLGGLRKAGVPETTARPHGAGAP